MTIRKLHKSDVESVIEIMQQALEESRRASRGTFQVKFSLTENKEYVIGIIKSKHAIGLIAKENEKRIGYLLAIPAKPTTEPLIRKTLWIDDIVVIPDKRRTGVGRMLFEVLERFARRRGYEEVRLNVHNFNKGGRLFYDKIGYASWSRILHKRL